MKKCNFLLVSAIVVGVMFVGCNPLKKMKENASSVSYNANPPVLELVGESVDVIFNGSYPPNYFNQNVTVTLTPVLRGGGSELELPELKVEGENVKSTENNRVIKYDTGGSFPYGEKIAYKPEFQVSELSLNIVGSDKKGRMLPFEPVKLADGIITTCLLVEKDGKTIFASDKYVRIIPDTYEADIKYMIQQAEVRTAETRKPEISALVDAVKAANDNERVSFTGTELSAYASPDGPTDLNEKLSGNRGRTGLDFFNRTFRTAKVNDVMGSDLLKVVNTPEDWEGFKTAMEKSNIRDKELVLRVLSMYSDPEVREREIKNITAAFEEIKEKILPELRRSKLTVNVELVGLSDEEINAQFDTDPTVLKLEEILYAGTLTQDDNRKVAIYQAAARQYPSDFRTKNNYGAALLNVGRTAEAKTALNEAKAVADNEMVKNNLAVVALREGNISAAEELLNAAGAGNEVKYNLGTVKIIQGNYNDAIAHFGNQVEVNAALAKLLLKDNDGALSTLNAIKSEDALVYYLKAIVGARTNNNDLMMNNLRTACQKSAELKANAAKDVEFAKFFSDSNFRTIVQ